MSEICPIRPSNEQLADSLVGEWEERPSVSIGAESGAGGGEQGYVTLEHPKMMAMRKNSSGKDTKLGQS